MQDASGSFDFALAGGDAPRESGEGCALLGLCESQQRLLHPGRAAGEGIGEGQGRAAHPSSLRVRLLRTTAAAAARPFRTPEGLLLPISAPGSDAPPAALGAAPAPDPERRR
ncbi:unnamed protein product [Coccothraustes coccothraustes]